ncbi:uncharacterized protein TRAVEDRAFT_58662 [Trametes versicolor FP-101664 SS1]|uniref:uncharacterized protein n=1 Tax=Trametes versicolor (strain FP-101664) TaxID=717944 RepID=UPI00046229BA|nr:uncharacterized protein TRAVEDRAFT_58662 [Trametes versicolor FP-101664 SS1]EIW58379.1 hypothetical protein TRAVEDRAFT_58662 [Trametes versicolor FP-101664 SS1]
MRRSPRCSSAGSTSCGARRRRARGACSSTGWRRPRWWCMCLRRSLRTSGRSCWRRRRGRASSRTGPTWPAVKRWTPSVLACTAASLLTARRAWARCGCSSVWAMGRRTRRSGSGKVAIVCTKIAAARPRGARRRLLGRSGSTSSTRACCARCRRPRTRTLSEGAGSRIP